MRDSRRRESSAALLSQKEDSDVRQSNSVDNIGVPSTRHPTCATNNGGGGPAQIIGSTISTCNTCLLYESTLISTLLMVKLAAMQ